MRSTASRYEPHVSGEHVYGSTPYARRTMLCVDWQDKKCRKISEMLSASNYCALDISESTVSILCACKPSPYSGRELTWPGDKVKDTQDPSHDARQYIKILPSNDVGESFTLLNWSFTAIDKKKYRRGPSPISCTHISTLGDSLSQFSSLLPTYSGIKIERNKSSAKALLDEHIKISDALQCDELE